MRQLIDFFLTYPRAFWGLCFCILLAWGLGWAFGEVTSEDKEKKPLSAGTLNDSETDKKNSNYLHFIRFDDTYQSKRRV